jgi:hypothetical protein
MDEQTTIVQGLGEALADADLEQVNAAGGGVRIGSDGANN